MPIKLLKGALIEIAQVSNSLKGMGSVLTGMETYFIMLLDRGKRIVKVWRGCVLREGNGNAKPER